MINKILNTREKKEIYELIKNQFFSSDEKFNMFITYFDRFVLLRSPKDRIYIINKEAFEIELSNLRIDNLGMYFGTIEKDGIRLSIEGSQIIGQFSDKNILSVNETFIKKWLSGYEFSYNDLDNMNIDFNKFRGKYILIKYKKDFVGCGKINQDRLMNFIPKSGRISADFDLE